MKHFSRIIGVALAVVTLVGVQLTATGTVFAASTTSAAAHYGPVSYSMDFTGFVADGYVGPVDLGTWTCSGVHVTHKDGSRDNFTCSTTATDVTATFTHNLPFPCGCAEWESDFDATLFSTNYEIDIANGTVTAWANYS
jgi:hypothetical protein